MSVINISKTFDYAGYSTKFTLTLKKENYSSKDFLLTFTPSSASEKDTLKCKIGIYEPDGSFKENIWNESGTTNYGERQFPLSLANTKHLIALTELIYDEKDFLTVTYPDGSKMSIPYIIFVKIVEINLDDKTFYGVATGVSQSIEPNDNEDNFTYHMFQFPKLTKTGHEFKGWKDENGNHYLEWNRKIADAFGVHKYEEGSPYSTINLTEDFSPKTYKVQYKANGGSGEDMANSYPTFGEPFRTWENKFTRTGYEFIGWNEESDGSGTFWGITLSHSGTYESQRDWKWDYPYDITLYAQWDPYTLTINYKKVLDSEDIPDSATDPLFSETIPYDVTTKIRTPKDKEIAISRLGYKAKDGYEWKAKEIRYKAKVEDNWKVKGPGNTINAGFQGKSNIIAEKLGTSIDSQYVDIDLIVNWEVNGLVNIYTNDGWRKAAPFIYTDKGWERAVPYIYYNNKWNMGG